MKKIDKLKEEHKHIWKYREGSNKRVCEAPIITILDCGETEYNIDDEWIKIKQ